MPMSPRTDSVHRGFGFGFLEAVYRRALAVELVFHDVAVAQEAPYELYHRGVSTSQLPSCGRPIVGARDSLRADWCGDQACRSITGVSFSVEVTMDHPSELRAAMAAALRILQRQR